MSTTKLFTQLATASVAVAIIFGSNAAGEANAAAAGPAPGETLSQSYRESQADNVEYQKVEPFKVFDNLYYVGPAYVSVWLITTPQGHILLDAAEEPYVDHVLDGIRKVGFDPADIAYILISHGHLDHFGGAARIQELSGARVGAIEEDWEMMEAAAARPGRNNGPSPRIPARDLVIRGGDALTFGGTSMIFYHTPGHTPGVLSAEFLVYDQGIPRKAFFSGGAGARGGLEGFQMAAASAELVGNVPAVEVTLLNHAWLRGNPFPNGSIFERAQALAQRQPGAPHPFVDQTSWTQWNAANRRRVLEGLEEARQNPGQ